MHPGRAGPPPASTGPREADVVWVGSSDGDPGLTDALAAEVSRRDDPPEVEMLVGSYDVPGSRLLDLVAVMDRLRSPGGCPWDAQQTHESLVPYLLEEAHEAVEAIESGDRGAHARGARRRAAAGGLPRPGRPGAPAARRSTSTTSPAASSRSWSGATRTSSPTSTPTPPPRWPRNWEQIKAAEKAGRTSVLDGIPAGLPALARADKAASRLHRAGLSALARAGGGRRRLGARLMALVLEARGRGEDPEAALRAVVRSLEQAAADAGR